MRKIKAGQKYQYTDCGCIIEITSVGTTTLKYKEVQYGFTCMRYGRKMSAELTWVTRSFEAVVRGGSIVFVPELRYTLLKEEISNESN